MSNWIFTPANPAHPIHWPENGDLKDDRDERQNQECFISVPASTSQDVEFSTLVEAAFTSLFIGILFAVILIGGIAVLRKIWRFFQSGGKS